jgi:anti-sigma regulatory factor (Ser/Thr protein kinase)
MFDLLGLLRGIVMSVLGDLLPRSEPVADDPDGAEVTPLKRWGAPATSLSGVGKREPQPPRFELARALAHEPSSISVARDALEPLARAVDPESFDNVRLLVSELVTNSVRHSAPETPAPIELSVVAAPHRVRAEVADGGAGFAPSARTEDDDDASGWGLHLLERLSDRWGVEQNGRTVVWFELEAAFAPQWWSDDVINDHPGENHRQASSGESPRALRRLVALRSFLGRRQRYDVDVD